MSEPPFVEDGEVVKVCDDCGSSKPVSEFVVDDGDLSEICLRCRALDEPTDLQQDISEARYGERLCRGFEMLGGDDGE